MSELNFKAKCNSFFPEYVCVDRPFRAMKMYGLRFNSNYLSVIANSFATSKQKGLWFRILEFSKSKGNQNTDRSLSANPCGMTTATTTTGRKIGK